MLQQKKNQDNLIQQSINGTLRLHLHDKEQAIHFLIDFFQQVRPSGRKGYSDAAANLQRMILLLEEHAALLYNFRIAIFSQLIGTNLMPALTESGLMQSRGFIQEFISRLNHKLLPVLQDEHDFLYVVNRVFYKKADYIWVEHIPAAAWKSLFKLVSFPADLNNIELHRQIIDALLRLSYKLVHLSLEPDVAACIPQEYQQDNPFIAQNNIVVRFTSLPEQEEHTHALQATAEELYQCLDVCSNCLQQVKDIQSVRGASLSLTYATLVMEAVLDRMLALIDTVDGDKYFHADKLVLFFKELVHNEKRKNSIRELCSKSFGYIAYQIAEHKEKKGTKYITATKAEYMKMLVSSMWGGFIICFVVVFKKLLSKVPMPPFWQGFLYGVNYSAGFIIIEETHSSLATKQPAFTASAVAASLDVRKEGPPNLYNLAITTARVARSQTASFIGNLIIVFPITYLFAWLYEKMFKHGLATTTEAIHMLQDQHPWKSMSLLYAANTGVFLFACGLLAGYVQNKMQFSRVALRLQKHPVLQLTMRKRTLEKFSVYIEQHLGSLVGNIVLGMLLGMSGIIMQKLFGIPFDIRHITIAAGNAAIAVYTLGFQHIPISYLLISILGVLLIGFVNFLVSFSLAFLVAVRSRGIHLKDYPEFVRILWRHFKRHPFSFIMPANKSEA